MASKLIPLHMSDSALAARIALLAKDSARVVLVPHARARMRQRRVVLTQVLEVLQKGRVVEPAHRNIHGSWQCTLERLASGDRIRVVAALEAAASGELVIVITVMN